MQQFRALRQAAMILLAFAGFIWILHLPQAGAFGRVLRYNFDFTLLLVGGILYLALIPNGSFGFASGLTAVLALFALPLTGLWASAAGEMHVLGGLLYFSDTAGYLWDANRLLDGGLFSAFAARRPLFPGLLAGLLGLTNHNLQISVAILVALTAIGCFLATWELRQTYGPAVAAFFLILLFLFYRRFIGMTDTENLGLALGAAAFALLWRGARLVQRIPFLVGALLLAMALMVRSGAFFALLALVLFGALCSRDILIPVQKPWAAAPLVAGIMLSLGIAMAVLLNLVVFRVTTDGRGNPFANYAYTFYGMAAGGKGWMQAYQDVPGLALMPEAQAVEKVSQAAWALIRQEPARFAQIILGQFADFFSLRDESVFGFVSGADLVIFDAPRAENIPLYRAVRLLLYGLSLVGLFWSFKKRTRLHGLLLFMAGGLVISVGFLPPRDAGLMRIYAATMPVLAAIPAVGMAALLKLAGKPVGQLPRNEQDAGWIVTVYGLGLVIVIIAVPLLVRAFARPIQLPAQDSCLSGEQTIRVRISPGSYLILVEDQTAVHSWLPVVRQNDFRNSLKTFPYRADFAGLGSIHAPVLLQNALDLETGRAFWLVLQTARTPLRPEVVTICGNWNTEFQHRNYDIFFGTLPEG